MRATQKDLLHLPARTQSLPCIAKRKCVEWLPVIGSLMVIALVAVLVLLQMLPPAVVARSAPATVFSAERALDHLQVIARAPHPTGSQENERVRDFLYAQFTLMGLQPEIQTSDSVYHDTGKWGISGPKGMEVGPDTWGLAGATVHNVMARIAGTDSSGAVVLAAHYDSVPYGPGASDDGAGVAAILEAARAIQAGPPLRNDIILLLTDGEEIGLMGAQAFVNHHPWMNDVALVLNLEARGSGGTVLMYETNPNNAWIIQEYARASVAPLTGSVATDVWRMMPNSSDLTRFLEKGKQGMNFAFGEDWPAYHTTQDSVEDIDLRSLQHHGANALALAKHYANLDLTAPNAEDAIFFSVLRLGVILYPRDWAIPLMLMASLVYLVVAGVGLRVNHFTWTGMGFGIAAFLSAAIASMLTGFLVVKALEMLKRDELIVGMGGTYNVHGYELGLLMVYLVISGGIYASFRRRTRPADLAMGALFFWFILTVASTLLLAGASYMFLWPLLAGLLVQGVSMFLTRPEAIMQRILGRLLLLVPVAVGLVLVGTVLYLVQLMFGIAILPAGGFLTVLILALVFPYLEFQHLPRPLAWLILPTALGLVLISGTAFMSQVQADQPRLNFAFYSLDADLGKAGWVAETHMPDDTLASLFDQTPHDGLLSDYFPTSEAGHAWVQEAPILDAPAPELQVIEDVIQEDRRTLRINMRSPRGATAIMAQVIAEHAILEASLYGETFSRDEPHNNVFFKVISVPESGVEFAVTLRAGVPLTIRLADATTGMPLTADQRAAFDAVSRSGYGGGHGIDSMTLVHRRYQFP